MTTPPSGTGSPRSRASSTRTRGSASSPAAPARATRSPTTQPGAGLHGARQLDLGQLAPRPAPVGKHLLRHRLAAEELRGRQHPALGLRALFQLELQARRDRRPDVQRLRAMGATHQLRHRRAGRRAAGRWRPSHTLRGGFLVQRERVTSFAQANTLPLVPDPADPDAPAIPGDQPVGLTDSSDLTGWTYSVYLQDEWKVLPTVTVNFGLRFDAITGASRREPAQPARQRRLGAQRRMITPACGLCPLLLAAAARPGLTSRSPRPGPARSPRPRS